MTWMRRRVCAFLLFLILITALASCSETEVVPYEELGQFLNEEQVALYQKAQKVYRLFRGMPDLIDLPDFFPNREGGPEGLGNSGAAEQISHSVNGTVRYVSCAGGIDSFSDLALLCGSVFTEDCWEGLNMETGWGAPLFLEIDNHLFHADCAMGSAPGYDPEHYPDTYELSFRSENEIRFSIIGHYKIYSSEDVNQYSIQTCSFPVKMVLEQGGWRFSMFADAGLDLPLNP